MRRWFGLAMGVWLANGLLGQGAHANNAAVDGEQGEETVQKETFRNLVYASIDGQELSLDLYVPESEAAEKPRLVVWIHGGGWRGGSKNKPPLRKLADCGYAVASISYRFTDTAIFPAQIHDCKAAIRWLRANADAYGYSAEWIAVAGSSAGGHLALLLGVSSGVATLEGNVGGNRDQSSQVDAIIDYYGPADFVLRGRTQPERAYTEKSGSFALLGGVREGHVIPELERTASPVEYVSPDDPPLLIFHGTQDEVVLMDQSEAMLNRYQQLKLPVELVRVEGAGHGGTAFFWGENFDRVVAFLAEHVPKR